MSAVLTPNTPTRVMETTTPCEENIGPAGGFLAAVKASRDAAAATTSASDTQQTQSSAPPELSIPTDVQSEYLDTKQWINAFHFFMDKNQMFQVLWLENIDETMLRRWYAGNANTVTAETQKIRKALNRGLRNARMWILLLKRELGSESEVMKHLQIDENTLRELEKVDASTAPYKHFFTGLVKLLATKTCDFERHFAMPNSQEATTAKLQREIKDLQGHMGAAGTSFEMLAKIISLQQVELRLLQQRIEQQEQTNSARGLGKRKHENVVVVD